MSLCLCWKSIANITRMGYLYTPSLMGGGGCEHQHPVSYIFYMTEFTHDNWDGWSWSVWLGFSFLQLNTQFIHSTQLINITFPELCLPHILLLFLLIRSPPILFSSSSISSFSSMLFKHNFHQCNMSLRYITTGLVTV